ncbi:hypothetical protein LTR17_016836 [Elasticomyces elasticus]|nr:hypothetical protein LTR17_016836 [Elasticomyces elasticus]
MATSRRTKIEQIKAIAKQLIKNLRAVTTLEELVDLESYDVAAFIEMRDYDIDHSNGVTCPGKERLLTHCQFLIENFRAMIKEVDESVQEAIDKEVSVLELLRIEGIMWCEAISDKTDEQIKMRDAIATGIFRVFIAVSSAAEAD